jgi:hypothetical protein
MPAWLRRGMAATQLAGDRSDLWPAGSLAWLAYIGWVPLIVVLGRPDPNDLAFFGVSLYTSSTFPFNVAALALAAVALFALLCLVAATAEVTLLRNAVVNERPKATPFGRAVLTAFTITILATLPAAAATAALLLGVIAVAPDEFQSPDIGTPVLLRLAAPLLPYLILVVLASLVGQAFGGMAIRRSHALPGAPVAPALASSARSLVRRPWLGLGVATGGMLVDAATLLFSFALLRVLWAPIAAALGDGRLASPSTLLLLLGFVTIWLALLLIAGALHVAVSAWWAMELARGNRGEAD